MIPFASLVILLTLLVASHSAHASTNGYGRNGRYEHLTSSTISFSAIESTSDYNRTTAISPAPQATTPSLLDGYGPPEFYRWEDTDDGGDYSALHDGHSRSLTVSVKDPNDYPKSSNVYGTNDDPEPPEDYSGGCKLRRKHLNIQNEPSRLAQTARHGPGGALATATHRSYTTALPASFNQTAVGACSYWLEDMEHRGVAPFNSDSSYQVFRNVKDFGAKGDGIADDAAAINSAIAAGNRCTPGTCGSSTTSPALVYFPAGTYVVSEPIIDYYYTQIIGNPNCRPVIKASSAFNGSFIIDGDRDVTINGTTKLGYAGINDFWRQIRNFVIDLTSVSPSSNLGGIHWPTGQASSLQNIVFKMSDAPGTQHQGVFIEEGSGGFMADLTFYGGMNGVSLGNQQFTVRNLTFYNSVTAINQIWDWGWTYQGISINNCSIGLNMATLDSGSQSVASVTFFDSSITDTPVGVLTARNSTSLPPAGGSLILENVKLKNVKTAVRGPGGATLLTGSTGQSTITGWAQGKGFQGSIRPNQRPASLMSAGAYYTRSKPQYETLPASSFMSVRSAGATGDGHTDDTAALQEVITAAASSGNVVFIDAGYYSITKTLYIPPGSRIVGESYPVILSSGAFFADMDAPKPVVQVGKRGEKGSLEWSDTIISTQGAQAGAVLIEYNLASPSSKPGGLWDVHTRIGGFAGSQLQLAQCPKTPKLNITASTLNTACIAAFASVHITACASGVNLENVWLWVADHDVDDPDLTQITVYAGRGLLVDSAAGVVWLVGTAVEHHALYQYQLSHTKEVFMGQIQTETAYYQPNPAAGIPFQAVPALNDPVFSAVGSGAGSGWGVRIVCSEDVYVYGAGVYSFFDNYNVSCSQLGNGEVCQARIFAVQESDRIGVYNLNTVGTTTLITVGDADLSLTNHGNFSNGFVDTIALFRLNRRHGVARVDLNGEGFDLV